MDTLKLFWFFLWRTSLLTTASASALGAVYGAVYGVAAIGDSKLGIVFALMVGPFLGVLLGGYFSLLLDPISGITLAVVASVSRSGATTGEHRYLRQSGHACAAVNVMVFSLLATVASANSPDEESALLHTLTLFFVLPALTATPVMWFVGYTVATRCARPYGTTAE